METIHASDGRHPWFSIHYPLDDQCWGYLIEHADDGVYHMREATAS